jgi:putative hemolysin
MLFSFLIALTLVTGCALRGPGGGRVQDIGLANPAAKYCVEQGNRYSITTSSDGSQLGYCTLRNNIVCEEWSYMRGECGASENATSGTGNPLSCASDSDCVPAECCHPKGCIPARDKRPCNLMCTQECAKGTMDCGQGSCRCISGSCEAVYEGGMS